MAPVRFTVRTGFAEKQHAREPGDLWNLSIQPGSRPVRKGESPYSGLARFRGVGLRHSTCEPVEQRGANLGGDGGGKGAGQGEHRSVPHSPDTERETGVPRI